ncbi:hypothetical protein [Coprobacter tertius]|uniref:Uncharacterized protein n=1 Tax=Coprobacter tertius TaxID=2944915 RepID=A0ABT1MJS3_9BACT|nr:hypothetical protein [Coprobacter tertius]MCP9612855.1 hypothetical protein [Coprobacter tertius]
MKYSISLSIILLLFFVSVSEIMFGQNRNPFRPTLKVPDVPTEKSINIPDSSYNERSFANIPLPPLKKDSLYKSDIPFDKAITMLGFEKRVKDKNETFLLKNNTPYLVTRVKLKLIYKTRNDEMIDYREITIDGEILPGTTKQFEKESFDKIKRYYYIKSMPLYDQDNGYPFKVMYELLRYDIAITK